MTAIPHRSSAARAQALLEATVSILRLPTAPTQEPDVLPDGTGLRCPTTGRIYPYRDGILELMPDAGEARPRTFTQHVLDSRPSAWVYDRGRGLLTRLLHSPDFAWETEFIVQGLELQPGDVLLDLACGHGNFTASLAHRVGQEGIVFGLDIAPHMLARAARRVRQANLNRVLLIHGDAHALPFASQTLPKVNCSGGFHQIPNLPHALEELARVMADDARLTFSTFAEGPADRQARLKHWLRNAAALHFVPMATFGAQLAQAGFTAYHWQLPGPWFGYATTQKAAFPADPRPAVVQRAGYPG